LNLDPDTDRETAVAGVADHHGWAVIVTLAADGRLIGRRRAELVDPGLPPSPIEHDAQALRLPEALLLVQEVQTSVAKHARALWDALAADHQVTAVAIREIPALPLEIEDQIRSRHAQTRADSAMYRRLLAAEASRRGWSVLFYDHHVVVEEALGTLNLDPAHLAAPRGQLGPPWTIDHRRAYAAALLACHDLFGT